MIELIRRLRINDRIPTMYYNDSEIRDAYRKDILIVGSYDVNDNPSQYAVKYFCIESLEDNNTITLNRNVSAHTSPPNENAALNNQYYVSSDLNTWTEYYGTQSWNINAGQKLYFKCITNRWYFVNSDSHGTKTSYVFSSSKHCNLSGNIMSLLYGDNFVGKTSMLSDYCFYNLFLNNNKIVSAKKLVLPATTLTSGCYREMFIGCTSLTAAPELPATQLELNCYANMFEDCTSLTIAPELPATSLANSCYYKMFKGCTSLVVAPELLATSLANSCYLKMFEGCTSLINAPQMSTATLFDQCYCGMFYNCTGLVNAPALPATLLAFGCYRAMFYGCTSLITAPELPANQLATYCYANMFEGCTNLNYIKCLATKIGYNFCLDNWVNGVASSGTFVKADSMLYWQTGSSGIPSGWTVVDYV